MKGARGIKGLLIGLICVALIAGYYFYLSNRRMTASEENVTVTAVQEILLWDPAKSYPPSPKEVVKLYSQITQCLYNEEYTDEEFEQLAVKIQLLYDDELIANQNPVQYMANLKAEVKKMKDNDCKISSYATSASTDVYYFEQDGFKWARLYCAYSIREKTVIVPTSERFLLRKDSNGHWKIYGWELVTQEE